MHVEYSNYLVFRSETILKSLYDELSRQEIFSIKPEQVANFLGKKVTPQLAQELGNRCTTSIQGTCIKHHLGKVSVTRYDKFHRVLRLEATTNSVCFFKHHRKVEHRDGHEVREIAPSERASTASSTCARSCSAVSTAIWNISPHWTTFPPAIATCID